MNETEETMQGTAAPIEPTVNPAEDEIAALERELAQAQDELADAQAQRERERRAVVLREEIAGARRQAKEEAALARAEAQYGRLDKDIARVDTIEGMILVKKPDGIKLRKWQDQHGDRITHDAVRQLVRPCVVYPSLDEFDRIVAERPVITVEAGSAVLRLGGLRLRELGGK